jgi:hypothetical protein
MRKEEVLAKFNVLSQYLHGGSERNLEEPQDNWSLSRSLNPGSPEYEAGMLTT